MSHVTSTNDSIMFRIIVKTVKKLGGASLVLLSFMQCSQVSSGGKIMARGSFGPS